MSGIATSPLPALIRYYERLEADSSQSVADFGFSCEKIHFQVLIEVDGSFAGLEDIRDTNERGKPIPKLLLVPDGGGRSGTGVKPFFCWDNTGYALGFDNKGNPERAKEMFAAFRDLHLSMRDELGNDDGYVALCRFLEQWDPAKSQALPNWEEAAGLNVVFRLRGREGFVHQSEAVKRAWRVRVHAPTEQNETERGISLVSGAEEDLARLHPLITGVAGANTMGAAIVSFNLDAFTSYGKTQSYNAPVGVRDAFRYTTALNRLLADDIRRVRVGDATVVFWTDRPEAKDAEEVFAAIFGAQAAKGQAAESGKVADRVRGFLDALRQGRLVDRMSQPEAPFYVLGLSPNASRINVRYWFASTVAQFVERLEQHADDLEIVGAPSDVPPPQIRTLLLETGREEKDVPPRLAGEVARAVLLGLPYPESLLNAVVRRIRADGVIAWRRAAILKACINREGRYIVDVYLNKEHRVKAYHCGRLLAVLSFAQEQALGTVNAGVIRRNLGSVMATPGLMLGRLQRAAELGHIPKLDVSVASFIRDELKAINVRLRDSIPTQLDLRQQSVFALGFYQQLQYLDSVEQQLKRHCRVRTSQGEWVRSKLEARVADALVKAGFPYIYESSAVLPGAGERWPDFVVRGQAADDDLYIEVLGMNTPEYNERWEKKLAAYEQFGVTAAGGDKGRLIVLDFRSEPFDDAKVLDALRPYMTEFDDERTEN